MIYNHSSNSNNLKNNIYEKPKISRIQNNKLQKASIISSPYITYGFMAKNLVYDKKYDLNNFIPEMKHNKPIIIGRGSYGKVFLYRNIIDNKLYAIKHMEKYRLYKTLKTLSGIYEEIYIQSRIFHKNIVRLLYVKENSQSFDLIMEYANKGSLFYYIRTNRYLTEKESFNYFSQIINAIYFLHKNDLIHRDIKPENILIFDNNICKICDFGWCVKLDGKQRKTFCGTTEYMSPEIVNKIEYSKEIDIWSLGILLYEMIFGYSPFKPDKEDFKPKDVIDNIKIHDLKFNKNISAECKDLICHLLDENVENRYKIEDIFNSKFVKKYEDKKLFFPEEEQKRNIYIKSIKLNNNNKQNNNNNNNNNSLKLYFSPTKQLQIFKRPRIISGEIGYMPPYLQNSSMESKEINNQINNIKINKQNYNYNNNQYNNKFINSNNNINQNKKYSSLSFENKKSKYNEFIRGNNLNLYNSTTYNFLNNNLNKKLNLSEQKLISKNNKTKDLNLNFINVKKKINNKNIKNTIKTKLSNADSSLNITSFNDRNDISNEESIILNNKKNNKCFSIDNSIYNTYLINNKRKKNLNNNYIINNIRVKKYSKDKNNHNNDFLNIKRPFATVKKLSNENNNNNNIINYNNNFFITYGKQYKNNKQYEKITILNNYKNNALTERDRNNPKDIPKDNNKRIEQLSFNLSQNNNFVSKDKNKKIKPVNSLELDKINNMANNLDIIKNLNFSSLDYNLNAHILNSENTVGALNKKINYNINTPIFEKTQNDNRNKNTYRSKSNRSLFNRNYIQNSSLNNNFDKDQINTNYIFNPKISITFPSNTPKSKIIKNSPKNCKIINFDKNIDNLNYKNLKCFAKSKSFLKTEFLNLNNKKFENNIKILKNKNFNMINNKRNKLDSLNKKDYHETKTMDTKKEKEKKLIKNNSLFFKGSDSSFLKNKKYIKMFHFSKCNNINTSKSNLKNKTKDSSDNLNFYSSTEEEKQKNKLNNYKIIQRNNNNEGKNISLKKLNLKEKLNKIIKNNNIIKNKIK